jgi:hypothetical protein
VLTCRVVAKNAGGSSSSQTDDNSATITAAAAAPVAGVNPGGTVRAPVGRIAHHLSVTLNRPGATSLDLKPLLAQAPTWTTVVPGGFGSATLVFNGDRRRDLPHLALVTIKWDQRVLFEGRIETPEVDWNGDAWTTTIQAYGKQRLLDETSIRRLWVMGVRTFEEATEQPVGTDGAGIALKPGFGDSLQIGNYDVTDATKLGFRIDPHATSNPTGFWVGARIPAPAVGVAVTRLSGVMDAVLLSVDTATAYPYRFVVQGYDGANATAAFTSIGTSAFRGIAGVYDQILQASWSAALGPSTTEIRVGYERLLANRWIDMDLAAYGFKLFGTSLSPNADGMFYGGAILTDLIGQISGLSVGAIDAGTDFSIPEVERSSRDYARNIVNEVAGYYRREWAVWEDGVFSWTTPDLDQTQWVAQLADGIKVKIRTDTDPMSRTVIITYTDPSDQRIHEASATGASQENPYIRTGQTKDYILNAPAPLTSATGSALASKISTDRGTLPVSNATITIPAGLMLNRKHGPTLPAYCIRAGENIRLAHAPSTKPFAQGRDGETLFHIVSTSCDGTMVTLECDGYQPAGDILLARLVSATKAITG